MKRQISAVKVTVLVPLALALLFLVSFQERVTAQVKQAPAKQTSPEEPLDVVDEMPQFQGGQDAMIQFISKELKYPAESRKKGIQGTSFIEFVVEKDGSVTRAKTIKGFDPDCDAEALRVIKSLPKWIPGKQAGKIVAVKYVMPIKFKV